MCGRRDIVGLMAFGDDAEWNRTKRVAQNGTYNSNPVVAAAGIAMLSQIADGKLHEKANALGGGAPGGTQRRLPEGGRADGRLRRRLHLPHLARRAGTHAGKSAPKAKNAGLVHKWRCAMILHGVDMSQNHGWVSAVHTEREIEETVHAVAKAVADLQAEGAV